MSTIALLHIAMEVWCIVFLVVVLICVAATLDHKDRRTNGFAQMMLCFIIALVGDIFAWYFRGVPGFLPGVAVRSANFAYFFAGDLSLMAASVFLTSLVEEEEKELVYVKLLTDACLLLAMFLLVGNLSGEYFYTFTEENVYQRAFLHPLHTVLEIVPLVANCLYVLRYFKKVRPSFRRMAIVAAVTYPVAMLIQELFYGFQLGNAVDTILLLGAFVAIYMDRHDAAMEEKKELLNKREEVLNLQTQNTIAMVSPHFLYNTLNTIYYLCEKDPKTAQKQISSLADYLRGHMDSLKTTAPVTFTQEMEQVEYYLNIEELRYGDKLEVEYDIEETDFSLPMLSVQLMVENAIKHGLHPKKEGGTVWIITRKQPDCYEVIVKDDGVGFDPEEDKKDGRSHTGINSVRERIRIISGGTLTINSEVGKGTESIIRIPLAR